MGNRENHECKQIEKITRIETNLDNMQKIQSMLLKITITLVSGILIEFFSIFFMYLINKKG
jgi:hypothetical protein